MNSKKGFAVLAEVLVTSLLLLAPQGQGRHVRRVECEGGRLEGDKWFDGCQWCVCELEGPVCSPRDCSHYVAHVPPCDNLGSRWHDGCYHCTCGISGIECRADRACMLREREGGVFLSGGKCMDPMDFRCICGVDGVPSCSAEVIDRSAYTNTLIAVNLTSPTSAHLAHLGPHTSPRTGSGYLPSDPRYDEYQDVYRFGSSRARAVQEEEEDLARTKRTASQATQDDDDDDLARTKRRAGAPHRTPQRPQHDFRGVARDINGLEDQDRFSGRQVGEDRYSGGDGGYPGSSGQAQPYGGYPSSTGQAPPSLLVATDNRCRFGPRWYGGSLRCYCDVSGSVTCGDPSFVASRIDGFRVDSTRCEAGHAWEDGRTCLSCECHFSSLVVCKRSPLCPLPFLIQSSPPVAGHVGREEFRAGQEGHVPRGHGDRFVDLELDETDDLPDIVSDGSGGNSRMPDEDRDGRGRGSSEVIVTIAEGGDEEDTIVIDLGDLDATPKPDLVLEPEDGGNAEYEYPREDKRRPHRRRHQNIRRRGNSGRAATTYVTDVKVMDCRPGSRWRDGCKRCSCSSRGRKVCNLNWCVKFPKPSPPTFDNRPQPIKQGVSRPMQRPPPVPPHLRRTKPIQSSRPENTARCGKFRLNQRYWVKCNLCMCTAKGPRCTAKSCG